MRFDVKRGLLPVFLILTILFVASSLFFTDDKMEKLTYARESQKLSRVVIVKQRNSPPIRFAKLEKGRIFESPPPPPGGNRGSHP
uniref:Uncharacterized protein n=1 Tax=Quercus lobata TaxID=97700 RepID=A0A7N2MN92_QUELO